ncbi:hydantoinase/carbamoylase family amidase [Acidisoma silvae]|uniref:Hydantoinase/carbamoylase family amidase n=1 Tax=Acidisoma silvae TaxID=2802396 RepID=A0A963YPS9_9PROT|nr:hydantoinase/carbamoylase family amidase [Acidisoma silvae]MCB8874374.1 hydantoinase/carbamoylase family amidase [Acidisoma silvae]
MSTASAPFRPNLPPDREIAPRLFQALHDMSFDGVGITREAYGPKETAAHALVRAEAEALGLAISTDHAGNMYLVLKGSEPDLPQIVIGSHLDSVRTGGNYDGAAGVLAGLSVVAGLARASFQPKRDITVMLIRSEEAGSWFPVSYVGSRASLGRLPADALDVARMDDGRTLADHMTEEGFDPDAVRAGKAVLSPENVAGFIELHIEQGPQLDEAEIPLGIVKGIPGSRRYRDARIFGEYNHSGATPRRLRKDAGIAAAELAYRLDAEWAKLEEQGHVLVCTFCVLATAPEAGFTLIPGEAYFQLDMRSESRESVDLLHDALMRLVAEIEQTRGVRFELGVETGSQASPMDATIQAELGRAAEEAGVPFTRMLSGGGHDTAAFAQAGIPACLMFVRNQFGSHNPREDMRIEDFNSACDVISRWVLARAG